MTVLYYAQRCKNKAGDDLYERTHAANNSATLCGKTLNEMWFLGRLTSTESGDITCKKCKKAMISRLQAPP